MDPILSDRSMWIRAMALTRSARTSPQSIATDAWREHFRWTQRRVSDGEPDQKRDDFEYMARPDPLRRLP